MDVEADDTMGNVKALIRAKLPQVRTCWMRLYVGGMTQLLEDHLDLKAYGIAQHAEIELKAPAWD